MRHSIRAPAHAMTDLSADLRRWRATMGFTQRAAANALGVGFETLSGWERGRACQMPTMLRLAMRCIAVERALTLIGVNIDDNAPAQPTR